MQSWDKIKIWRKARRGELIAARSSVARGQREAWGQQITTLLNAIFAFPSGTVVGFCWPYRNEFDARFAVRHWRDRGVIAALPEVVEKARPLQFRQWWPGAPMRAGAYGIPVPDGTEIVLPDAAMVPMNGFDEQGYRLGYGGGYFDRTLAAMGRRVLAIGVSYEALRLPTIHPQPHDIPMDLVVTEAGAFRAGGRELVPLDAAECAAHAKSLMESRGLPRGRRKPSATTETAQETCGYSSPPCYAHEVAPDYFGELPVMTAEEVVSLLNGLLEAERAGARVLAAFLNDYERDTPSWKLLAAVQRDEARNCAILMDLIRRVGGVPSPATGDFLEKALAVKEKSARLRFLNRGQHWVARRIHEALPRLQPGFVRDALVAMRESHLLNIEACDALAEMLEAPTSSR